VGEFSDNDLGNIGARCFERFAPFNLTLAAKCLTPGDEYSQAPARGVGTQPSRMLFLVGDSHASMYVPMFGAALEGESMYFAYAAVGNGAGFHVDWPDPPPCGDTNNVENCERITSRALEAESAAWAAGVRAILDGVLRPGDVVAVSTTETKFPHTYYVSAQRALLAEVARNMSARGATLLLVADPPNIKDRGRRCVTPETFGDCVTPRSQAAWYTLEKANPQENGWQLHEEIDQMLASLAAEHSAVEYLDSAWVWDKMCDAQTDTCGPAVPGTTTVAWLDMQHLSTAGALYLGPFLNCWLHEKGLL